MLVFVPSLSLIFFGAHIFDNVFFFLFLKILIQRRRACSFPNLSFHQFSSQIPIFQNFIIFNIPIVYSLNPASAAKLTCAVRKYSVSLRTYWFKSTRINIYYQGI